MKIISTFSKIIPEGSFKDTARFPIYWFLNKLKFVKKELVLYKNIRGYFYFYPWEKAEEYEYIGDYFNYYRPKKGDIVIDAGAFVGQFTVAASRLVGNKGKVIAIEPDPFNRANLEKTIKANRLHNVIVISYGLSNKKNKIGWSVGGIISQRGKSKMFTIKTTTLDVIFKELKIKNVDLIKMDIEGAEIEAIKGAEKMLMHTKNLAIASYHIVKGKKTCFEIEKILKKSNFLAKTANIGQLITFAGKER